jgi:hypothetical protein
MWSVDYLARGIFRSRTAGKLAKFAFAWVRFFDRFIPPDYAIDGASGVYFFGTKAAWPMPAAAMVSYYRGAQRDHGT